MKHYNPPINTKTTDELIIIVNSDSGEWQTDAIEQAKIELIKRNINPEKQKTRITELLNLQQVENDNETQSRKNEDYSPLAKIGLVIFWYRSILNDWDLKKRGYEIKYKTRIRLITVGIAFYFFLFVWAFYKGKEMQTNRIKEIEKVDISKWKRDRISNMTIDSNKKSP